MTDRARMAELASQLVNQPKVPEPQAPIPEPQTPRTLIANRPHGDKGDHIKITVTLPPEVYALIAQEVTRRKLAKEPDAQLSAIIREALVTHLR